MVKNILVTGGTKGIGRAISLELSHSHNVIINYSSDENYASRTYNDCLKINPKTLLIKADVSVRSDVEKMFDYIIEKSGTIDGVINNAGINIDRAIMQMTDYDWDRVVDVNMKGVFLVSQIAAKFMLNQPAIGHIINISATTGISGRTNGLNYCASKAGIIVMTKCLAREFGSKIKVNCILPGFTRTEESIRRFNLERDESKELLKRQIPLDRLAEPEEIAKVTRLLVSDDFSYFNGQKLIIDGGEYMY